MVNKSSLHALFAVVLTGLLVAGCGYNTIPTLEEQAKARWGDVQNQYQRRADLIPNLVATVQGYAKQEKDVLTSVVEARALLRRGELDRNVPKARKLPSKDDGLHPRRVGIDRERSRRERDAVRNAGILAMKPLHPFMARQHFTGNLQYDLRRKPAVLDAPVRGRHA